MQNNNNQNLQNQINSIIIEENVLNNNLNTQNNFQFNDNYIENLKNRLKTLKKNSLKFMVSIEKRFSDFQIDLLNRIEGNNSANTRIKQNIVRIFIEKFNRTRQEIEDLRKYLHEIEDLIENERYGQAENSIDYAENFFSLIFDFYVEVILYNPSNPNAQRSLEFLLIQILHGEPQEMLQFSDVDSASDTDADDAE